MITTKNLKFGTEGTQCITGVSLSPIFPSWQRLIGKQQFHGSAHMSYSTFKLEIHFFSFFVRGPPRMRVSVWAQRPNDRNFYMSLLEFMKLKAHLRPWLFFSTCEGIAESIMRKKKKKKKTYEGTHNEPWNSWQTDHTGLSKHQFMWNRSVTPEISATADVVHESSASVDQKQSNCSSNVPKRSFDWIENQHKTTWINIIRFSRKK